MPYFWEMVYILGWPGIESAKESAGEIGSLYPSILQHFLIGTFNQEPQQPQTDIFPGTVVVHCPFHFRMLELFPQAPEAPPQIASACELFIMCSSRDLI